MKEALNESNVAKQKQMRKSLENLKLDYSSNAGSDSEEETKSKKVALKKEKMVYLLKFYFDKLLSFHTMDVLKSFCFDKSNYIFKLVVC